VVNSTVALHNVRMVDNFANSVRCINCRISNPTFSVVAKSYQILGIFFIKKTFFPSHRLVGLSHYSRML
jgi:hypothetical protein